MREALRHRVSTVRRRDVAFLHDRRRCPLRRAPARRARRPDASDRLPPARPGRPARARSACSAAAPTTRRPSGMRGDVAHLPHAGGRGDPAHPAPGSRRSIAAAAWGPGAEWAIDGVPGLLGRDDDWSALDVQRHAAAARQPAPQPGPPARRAPAGCSRRSLPAIIEQRVTSLEAYRSWARLLRWYGEPAPGPAPDGMRVVPTVGAVARHPVVGVAPGGRRPAAGASRAGRARRGAVAGAGGRIAPRRSRTPPSGCAR